MTDNIRDAIYDLNKLISKPKKGSSGYSALTCSERVTAHHIELIINRLSKAIKDNSKGNKHESNDGKERD